MALLRLRGRAPRDNLGLGWRRRIRLQVLGGGGKSGDDASPLQTSKPFPVEIFARLDETKRDPSRSLTMEPAAAPPLALIVEDEEMVRSYAASLLEEHGFSVVEAADAASALKVLETRRPVTLLFTDIQLPGKLDGIALSRETHARWPHVLLIVASGGDRRNRNDLPDDGRFIEKPYRAQDLYNEVDDLLAKHGRG